MKYAALALVRALALLCGLSAPPAFAHAFLDHAQPAVGSTLHAPPTRVQLWFTQQLEPAFSKVHVENAAGTGVDKGDSHVDDADPTLLSVDVPPLPAGTYRVRWRVVSVDTHVTEGDFTFTVAQ